MKKITLTAVFVSLFALSQVSAQAPIYLVNGEIRHDISDIRPDDIEKTTMLPVDEALIAQYGHEASNGVIAISLRYDTPARFPEAEGGFNRYIASQIEWEDPLPVARVVIRYTITETGETLLTDELEVTDRRLKRRVAKAVEEAPRWQPALRNGEPVATQGVLQVQLPEGAKLPRERAIIIQ